MFVYPSCIYTTVKIYRQIMTKNCKKLNAIAHHFNPGFLVISGDGYAPVPTHPPPSEIFRYFLFSHWELCWGDPEWMVDGTLKSSHILSSIQDGICALRKAHLCSTPPLRSFLTVAFETVSVFVWLMTALSSFQGRSCNTSSFHACLLQAIDGVMSLALCPQMDDGPLSFQGRSSSTSSFSTSLLQVIDGVMSMALCPLVVFQAPQHFRSSEMQATCEGCFACQSICWVISLHSGMSTNSLQTLSLVSFSPCSWLSVPWQCQTQHQWENGGVNNCQECYLSYSFF